MTDETRETFEFVVGSGLTAILTSAYTVMIGRHLGPAEYSDFAAALSILYLFGVAVGPVSATVAHYTARFAARGESARIPALRRAAKRAAAVVSLVIAGTSIVVILQAWRALRFDSPASPLLAVGCVIVFLFLSIDRGLLQGLTRFRDYNVNSFVEAGFRLAAGVALVAWLPAAELALGAYLAAMLLAAGLLQTRIRYTRTANDRHGVGWHEVKRFALPSLLVMVAVAAYQNADMLVVKRWFSAADAGAYGAATTLTRVLYVVVTPFWLLLVPFLTARRERGEVILPPLVRAVLSFLAVSVVPLSILTFWSTPVVRILYGVQFDQTAPLLAPLALVVLLTCLGLLVAQALALLGSHRFLYIYLGGAATLVGSLCLFHATLPMVIATMMGVQGAVLILLVTSLINALRRGLQGGGLERTPEAVTTYLTGPRLP